jgi:hypothetical protein
MTELLLVLSLGRNVAWTLYMGVVVSFALMSIFSTFEKHDYLLWFRKFGVILGLSLGTTILSSVVLTWFDRLSFYPQSTLETIGLGIGFVMWVSNIILEIWTLDPVRKFDLHLLDDSRNIEAIHQRSIHHIRLQALLCVLTFGFLSIQ